MSKEYKISNKNPIRKWIEPTIFWDWFDFGLVFKVYKQNNIARYRFAVDMLIAWLNLWLQCWKKN